MTIDYNTYTAIIYDNYLYSYGSQDINDAIQSALENNTLPIVIPFVDWKLVHSSIVEIDGEPHLVNKEGVTIDMTALLSMTDLIYDAIDKADHVFYIHADYGEILKARGKHPLFEELVTDDILNHLDKTRPFDKNVLRIPIPLKASLQRIIDQEVEEELKEDQNTELK